MDSEDAVLTGQVPVESTQTVPPVQPVVCEPHQQVYCRQCRYHEGST